MLGRTETIMTAGDGFPDTTGTVTGVTVTAGAANTKGSYQTIDGSTAFDCDGLFVHILNASAAYRGLVDIALQTSNHDIIIPDILVDFNRADAHAYGLYFPVCIPAGTPITARLAATTGSVTLEIALTEIQAGDPAEAYLTTVEAIGVDTTDGTGASAGRLECGGSAVDPGGTVETLGAWKELTASTAFACYQAMLVTGSIQNTASATTRWRVQVGVGSAGTEDIVIDGLAMGGNASSDEPYPTNVTFPFPAPAGSRVAVRAACNINDATDRLVEVAMYLFS